MGLLDFPKNLEFDTNIEVKNASYIFKDKNDFIAFSKKKAVSCKLTRKAILKISKSKGGFFVIEPNTKFGKVNDLRYSDITGVWKAVRYWNDFGIQVRFYITI